jgi:hypothetical protein
MSFFRCMRLIYIYIYIYIILLYLWSIKTTEESKNLCGKDRINNLIRGRDRISCAFALHVSAVGRWLMRPQYDPRYGCLKTHRKVGLKLSSYTRTHIYMYILDTVYIRKCKPRNYQVSYQPLQVPSNNIFTHFVLILCTMI